ncbi:granzyme N isoform X2 [Rattus norvegicus]|nr:granzyme N isoform X1 [Rattus norvegicus]XP_038949602.1 granzyme N isoform X1 [Rattus norvegicus]XP_038949603.1 granzyme N isoform X1 [Rattus norvegicus]
MPAVLILLTFLLPLGDGAVDGNRSSCGGFLVRDYFVLTAAHCTGSSMTVILGAHNLHEQEKTQQIIPVEKAIPHLGYNPLNHSNDIMLLKLESKAKRTKAVRTLRLPGRKDHVNPGDVCGVAGWGKTSINANKGSALLEEAELIIQGDAECKKRFRHYSETTEICAGDPNEIEAPSKGCVCSALLHLSRLPGKMPPVLILLTLLLPLEAGAEEIIGGHEVKPHSYPYMAFIQSVKADGNISYCGGFLVQDYFVLTAAHCEGESMTVMLGAHNIKAKEDTQQIISVEKAISHPAYNKVDYSYDIMLLKLKSKAKRTKAVSTLMLPQSDAQVKPGDVCHVAGWGLTSINGTKVSSCLREAELIIQEDQECEKIFYNYFKTIQICAGDPNNVQDASKGDSGGPLVCDNRAYGVIAYGKKGEISSGVFTKVVYFLPWISRNMKVL